MVLGHSLQGHLGAGNRQRGYTRDDQRGVLLQVNDRLHGSIDTAVAHRDGDTHSQATSELRLLNGTHPSGDTTAEQVTIWSYGPVSGNC